jgi:hypothetical protein
VEEAQRVHNLIQGCNLLKNGFINTDTDSQMSPEESKLLLMDLLKAYDREFTPNQIPRLSGLECGIVNGTGHHAWATRDELSKLGEKVTPRSYRPAEL